MLSLLGLVLWVLLATFFYSLMLLSHRADEAVRLPELRQHCPPSRQVSLPPAA